MINVTTREFLNEATLSKEDVDRFLDPHGKNWATFDTELGYLLQDSTFRDGIDNSYTLTRFHPTGERRMVNFSDQPCRINTYGNSFTQCAQVSDGETWQEYLSAHIGEPIRNFGIGGYGVYQAYRRMIREERRGSSASYVVLNIWSDDHFRSIYPWRWPHISAFRRSKRSIETEYSLFHANPWAHVRYNLSSAKFEECDNPYPTRDSLYLLCDQEYVYNTFRNNFDVQASLAIQYCVDVNVEVIREVAEALDIPTDFRSAEATSMTARETLRQYALRASMYIMNILRTFVEAEGKRLMLVLSYSQQDVEGACGKSERFDQEFVDYLTAHDFLFVDTLAKHFEDFQSFKCTPEEYASRYYFGHYNPKGNHFLAFALKDTIVRWLDPPPPAYQRTGPSLQALVGNLA